MNPLTPHSLSHSFYLYCSKSAMSNIQLQNWRMNEWKLNIYYMLIDIYHLILHKIKHYKRYIYMNLMLFRVSIVYPQCCNAVYVYLINCYFIQQMRKFFQTLFLCNPACQGIPMKPSFALSKAISQSSIPSVSQSPHSLPFSSRYSYVQPNESLHGLKIVYNRF